jgi:photosystem II stability/assembly factor-like uncharacterized protein
MRIRSTRTLVIALATVAVVWQFWSTLPDAVVEVSGQQAGVWRHIGPTPILPGEGPRVPARYNSGRAISIAGDPADPNHWLAGAATGGIWTTRNAGQTWASNTDGLFSLAIGAIAFAPGDPQMVYAGTGEANFSRDARAGGGILKSVDGGSNWSLVSGTALNRAAVAAIRVSPANPNVVLAATSRGAGNGRFSEIILGSTPMFGLLRSTDGGATWSRALTGQATALEIDSSQFNNQYTAISDVHSGRTNDSPGSQPNGLYRSTDGGQNWSPVEGPWVAMRPGRLVPAIAPSNPNVMYVSVSGLVGDGAAANTVLGLYRTENAWSATPTWARISTDATGPQGYCSIQCTGAHVVIVHPTDPNTIYAGGRDELWRCRNCGSAPVWKGSGTAMHSDHRALAWAGNRLLSANDGGIASTIDNGETWQGHNATLSITQIFSGALHPTNPQKALAGTKDNGCVVWSGGAGWEMTYGPQHGVCEGDVAISASHPDTDWMASANFGEINRTRDGGRSFTVASRGITEPIATFTGAVRKCPANDDVFLTGNTRLWRTNDFFSAGSPTWSANGPENAGGEVRAIAFAESDRDCNTYAFGVRALSAAQGRIWLTTNGGSSWTDITGANLPSRTVNSIAFDPRDPNTVFAAYGNFDSAARPGHVFKTTNALATSPVWTNVSPPEDQPENVVIVDPVNSSTVYVGSERGVWRSTNGGDAWSHMGPAVGMPNVPVNDLKIHPQTRDVYAFTFGRGVFVLSPP